VVSEQVVIVGNGVSGYACAARLAEQGVDVTMIGPGLPHDRPPLSKRAIATGKIPYLADHDKMAAIGIRHVDGTVTATDLTRRRLTVQPTGAGDPIEIAAPRLVWATGFVYPFPPVPGIPEIAQQNATADGLIALRSRLIEPERRVIVVGAGLIGTETAATLAVAGHRVTLVDMLDRPLARLHPVAADAARSTLGALGVTFLGDCRIDGAHTDGADLVIETSTHGQLVGDVLVTAAGFRTSLPSDLAPDGRALTIDVDETLRVIGHDQLWACGDCITFPHPRWGRISIPHWDHALHSGRHAAASVMGSPAPYVRDPYYFSDIGPLRIQQVGLASAAVVWRDEDDWTVGRDQDGQVAAVLFLNAPARLGEHVPCWQVRHPATKESHHERTRRRRCR
jgi:3-phenylpropionate/trans-cinnamate dioxygenase ferredoxin reductase component